MEENKALNPSNIGFFCTATIMPGFDRCSHLIEQFRRLVCMVVCSYRHMPLSESQNFNCFLTPLSYSAEMCADENLKWGGCSINKTSGVVKCNRKRTG